MNRRQLLAAICMWLVTGAAAAQSVPPVAPVPAAADRIAPDLGRLFYTPERRAQLDRQRQFNIRQSQALEGDTLSLDGIVRRSSGKSTVWINQRAQHENEAERTGVAISANAGRPGQLRVAPGEDAAVDLRVGEAINRGTGERTDRLGGGRIVTPAKP